MTRKRKQPKNKAILDDFANTLTSKDSKMKFKMKPKGEISMSDAISDLIEPFKEDAPDYEGFRNLVTYGCIAWNAANLPRKEQDELINKMLASIPLNLEDRLALLGLITELMDRKKKLFPDVTRMIVDFKVTYLGENFHIAVASTLDKEKTVK
jgi:hypothetical protein